MNAKWVNKRGLMSILGFDNQKLSKGWFQHASCKHEKPNSLWEFYLGNNIDNNFLLSLGTNYVSSSTAWDFDNFFSFF